MVSFGANPFLLFFSLQIVGKPFSIQDNQLIQHLIPVPISLCPFPDYVFAGKIQHLFQCCIAWKYTLGFCDFPVLTVQSLYDVGCDIIRLISFENWKKELTSSQLFSQLLIA